MDKWWLNPLLDGDDYGKYDFYATSLPESYAKWEFNKVAWDCDECKKGSHLAFVDEYFFYTLDGYDSISNRICWKCFLKNHMRSVKWKFKRNFEREIKILKTTKTLYCGSNKSPTFCYKTARELCK